MKKKKRNENMDTEMISGKRCQKGKLVCKRKDKKAVKIGELGGGVYEKEISVNRLETQLIWD